MAIEGNQVQNGLSGKYINCTDKGTGTGKDRGVQCGQSGRV